MVWRSRTRNLRTPITGTYKYLAGGTWYTVNRTYYHGINMETQDEVGEWSEDNGFHSWFYRASYPVLNGANLSGSRVFSNFAIDGAHAPQTPDAPFPHPVWADVALDAAARTNPNKPLINLPAFLGELKDLPGLLRSIPETLRGAGLKYLAPSALKGKGGKWTGPIQDLANANLAYAFGWRPFVAGLASALDCVRALQAAIDMINALMAGKSIKRRAYYPLKTSYTNHGTMYTHTLGATLRHKKETVWYSREWVTTRWSATGATPLPKPGDFDALLKLAFRLLYGIHQDGLTAAAWELLPWSWLIDWFWNLGKWLGANANFLQLHLDSLCWMRTTSSYTSFTLVEGPDAGLTLVGPYFTASSLKERHPISPSLVLCPPTLGVPCLSTGQLGILGSLLAQKGKWAF